jgi:hypothetical protein
MAKSVADPGHHLQERVERIGISEMSLSIQTVRYVWKRMMKLAAEGEREHLKNTITNLGDLGPDVYSCSRRTQGHVVPHREDHHNHVLSTT